MLSIVNYGGGLIFSLVMSFEPLMNVKMHSVSRDVCISPFHYQKVEMPGKFVYDL